MPSDGDRGNAPDPTPGSTAGVGSDAVFVRRALYLLMLIGLAWLLLALSQMLLLIFGAVLVAVIFDTLAAAISRVTHLPHRWALLAAVLVVFAVIGLSGWLFGAQVIAQFAELQQTLPKAWHAFEAWLGNSQLGDRVVTAVRDWAPSGTGLLRNVRGAAVATVGALGSLVLVAVAGIYFAAQSRLYRHGVLQLVPLGARQAARDAARATGHALRSWLRTQLIMMVTIGVLTTLGLWAIGVPSMLALGLLAGLAEFVPVIGPIIAAVPALLIALTLGVDTALWTLGFYLVLQQLEGNVLMPIVTQHAVSLPPALALFSVVALGLLFGPLGVLLGAPIAIVVFVLVRELYVKRALGGTVQPLAGSD